MNKKRIITFLNLIQGSAKTIPQLDQKETEAMSKNIIESAEYIKEMVNEKPIMPKVFTDWYKFVANDCRENPEDVKRWIYLSYMQRAPISDEKFCSKEEIAFGKWLGEDLDKSAERQQLATNAIMDGFEVEK